MKAAQTQPPIRNPGPSRMDRRSAPRPFVALSITLVLDGKVVAPTKELLLHEVAHGVRRNLVQTSPVRARPISVEESIERFVEVERLQVERVAGRYHDDTLAEQIRGEG